MGLSLQEQLLKAGLADKKKANKINKQKHKQRKDQQKHKLKLDDEAKRLANEALEKKRVDSQTRNQAINDASEKKALVAQIKQLIESNKQPKNGEVLLNFTDNNVIKRLYVDDKVHKAVTNAKLAVVRAGDGYELVATPVANKIAERDESFVVYIADLATQQDTTETDDWYGDYEIPDDLMW